MKIVDRFWGLVARLLAPINYSVASFLGFYTISWGLWIGNPFWKVFDKAPLYDWLSSVATEVAWGIFSTTCGVLIVYGVMRATYRALRLGAHIAFFHWGLVGFFYLLGDWQDPGGVTALFFSIYAAYIYLNLRVNRFLLFKRPPDIV